MKRPSDDDAGRSSSADSKAEEFLSRFLRRHPRLLFYLGIGLAALIVIALVVAKFSRASH